MMLLSASLHNERVVGVQSDDFKPLVVVSDRTLRDIQLHPAGRSPRADPGRSSRQTCVEEAQGLGIPVLVRERFHNR